MSGRDKLGTREQGDAGRVGCAVRWTESLLRRSVEQLFRQALEHEDRDLDGMEAAADALVELGLRPKVFEALCQRRDPQEAVRDLATRYAFAQLMIENRRFQDLDPLSRMMIRHTLDVIYKRAFQVAERTGEDPLDEDPGLLISICKCLSHYVPRKPLRAHITWKLRHYEGAVSRAMRQIENLVRRPEVTKSFAALVIEASLPDTFKAQLLQMARGGGRAGLDYGAVIRFFARSSTVSWVKRWADTVQTARTLYCEEEYEGIPWRGPRRLPRRRRQGYLEAALASLARRDEVSLDTPDWDLHDTLDAPTEESIPMACW